MNIDILNNSKLLVFSSWLKKISKKIMPHLSKLSKSFLLPIALLPIAGLFLGIGATICSKTEYNNTLWLFGNFLNKMGDIAFNNLPVLFAISVTIAYTEDAGVAAITAIIGFLVFNIIQSVFLISEFSHYQYIIDIYGKDKYQKIIQLYSGLTVNTNSQINQLLFNANQLLTWMKNSNIYKTLVERQINKDIIIADNIIIKSNNLIIDSFKFLFYSGEIWGIKNKLITNNLGINSFNTGVFGGICVGIISSYIFNKFHKTQLPMAINFFSGSKLVPIIVFISMIPLSFLFLLIWPLIGVCLSWFGNNSNKLPIGLDSLIFEIFERSLVPFGLHHVFYASLWWTQAGGSIPDLINAVLKNPKNYMNFIYDINGLTIDNTSLSYISDLSNVNVGELQALVGEWISKLNPNTISAIGDQTIMYKIIADPWVTFTQIQHLGLNLGRFQTGKFPFMIFGLPAAALAMLFSVPKKNRKKVMGIYLSTAFTCFLTGITEPIEFTFLFIAPWLFYGIHMPLCAISFMLMNLFNVHVSMTVSGGILDFIIFGIIPFIAQKGTNFYHILWLGAIYAIIYFSIFFLIIKYVKINIPGHENITKNLQIKKSTNINNKTIFNNLETNKDIPNLIKINDKKEKANKIIYFLGGEKNIKSVDSCASRLRIIVKNNILVNNEEIKNLGGCAGIIIHGELVQCVYGGEQEILKFYIQEILKEQRNIKP